MTGGHVHALDLGDLGVEVAHTADRRRLAVADRQQHHPVRRVEVPRRPGRQLGLDDVEAELGVGLADEVGVEPEDRAVVPDRDPRTRRSRSSNGQLVLDPFAAPAPVES